MSRRVSPWLARVAVAVYGVAPFVLHAQETAPPIVIIDDSPADASTPPPANGADSTPTLTSQPTERSMPPFWIGFHFEAISEVVKTQLDISHGLTVTQVAESSPAQKAGIQKHDIIVTANGKATSRHEDVFRILAQTNGGPIDFEILRKGKTLAIRVTPEKRPEIKTIEVPRELRPLFTPAVPPTAPTPPQPALPPTDPSQAEKSQAEQWIREVEQAIAQEREAAANHLRDARGTYEEALKAFDSADVEAIIKSAIDEISREVKDRVSEGIKALHSDEAKAMHREVLDAMGSLERALRDSREEAKREAEAAKPKRESIKEQRIQLRDAPDGIESLRQEIKSLREEIERLKRETK